MQPLSSRTRVLTKSCLDRFAAGSAVPLLPFLGPSKQLRLRKKCPSPVTLKLPQGCGRSRGLAAACMSCSRLSCAVSSRTIRSRCRSGGASRTPASCWCSSDSILPRKFWCARSPGGVGLGAGALWLCMFSSCVRPAGSSTASAPSPSPLAFVRAAAGEAPGHMTFKRSMPSSQDRSSMSSMEQPPTNPRRVPSIDTMRRSALSPYGCMFSSHAT
jgi:hypothetical protein